MTLKKDSPCIQLKADFVPITVLRLQEAELDPIGQKLKQAVAKAPNYFYQSPIIIDLGGINESLKPFLDLKPICALLHDLNMIPIGVRGLSKKHEMLAKDNRLALFGPKGLSRPEDQKTTEQKPTPDTARAKNHSEAKPTPTRIIKKPVRSGTQIYAKDSDLIVLASVNPGAEVIADGHIHIHGALRGRALAGAHGNPSAHIFCQTLEAELVAIAGHYLLSEQLPNTAHVKSMVHFYLHHNQLTMDLT